MWRVREPEPDCPSISPTPIGQMRAEREGTASVCGARAPARGGYDFRAIPNVTSSDADEFELPTREFLQWRYRSLQMSASCSAQSHPFTHLLYHVAAEEHFTGAFRTDFAKAEHIDII